MAFVRAMTSRGTRRNQVHRSSSVLILPLPIEETFVRETEELRWLANVILGGEQHVEECLTEATRIAESGGYVSPEWLRPWARRATARAAVERVRSQIQMCLKNRTHATNAGVVVPELGMAKKRALRSVPIEGICADCDALERAALLLHGYPGFSAQDCALMLGCRRSAIVSACSSALAAILHESPAEQAETGGIACLT